ncbi:MAG TPA: hypothetical protein DCY13_00765, partial [Verrucomicrobiales bacterium]|nr:hypothetical protein [Verrucomicrobiales bacterium]
GTQGTNSFAAERVTLWLTPQRGLQRLLAVGDVVLRQGGTVLGAGQLNAEFDGEEGGLIRADATDNVRICGRQAGGAGRATGRELGFLATTGDATLLGDPELIFWQSPIPPKEGETGKPRAIPPIRHSGDQIIWNLRTGSIRGEGQYRVLTLPADVEIPRDCD